MKNIKEYILEGQGDRVPVEALLEFLRDFNPDLINDQYFIDMFSIDYGMDEDLATELVKSLSDAAMDEAYEVDPKLLDDLFNADKWIKDEVNHDYYLVAYKRGWSNNAYAIPITSRKQNQKELKNVLAKIKWKPTNYNVMYNF